MATIVNPDHRPQMATVRSGVMQKKVLDENYKGETVYPNLAQYVQPESFVVKVLDRHVEEAKHNLKGSPIVVAGGYGVGSKEGFDLLSSLLKNFMAKWALVEPPLMLAGSTTIGKLDKRVLPFIPRFISPVVSLDRYNTSLVCKIVASLFLLTPTPMHPSTRLPTMLSWAL